MLLEPHVCVLQLHAKLLEAERQLGELQGRLKEQRQLSGEKLKDREQQVTDLQLKLSRVEEQVGKALCEIQNSTYEFYDTARANQHTTGRLRPDGRIYGDYK